MQHILPPQEFNQICPASDSAARRWRPSCRIELNPEAIFHYVRQCDANRQSRCVIDHESDGYDDNLAESLVSVYGMGRACVLSSSPFAYRRCREEFRSVLRVHRRTQAEKILLLLVESGAAYCASGVSTRLECTHHAPHTPVFRSS